MGQQPLLEREGGRGRPPARADLGVDVGDVALDRRDRDDQLVGDLTGR